MGKEKSFHQEQRRFPKQEETLLTQESSNSCVCMPALGLCLSDGRYIMHLGLWRLLGQNKRKTLSPGHTSIYPSMHLGSGIRASPALQSWVGCLWWESDIVSKTPWGKRPKMVTLSLLTVFHLKYCQRTGRGSVCRDLLGRGVTDLLLGSPHQALIKMFRARGRAPAEASLSRWDLFTYCPNHFTSDGLVAVSSHRPERGGHRWLHCLLNQP